MTRRLLNAPKKSDMFIYGLFDPRTREIRYVGQTAKGIARAWQHCGIHALKIDKNNHKRGWIQQLQAVGLKYEVDVLERCSSYEALDEAEVFWIKHLLDIGVKLTNKSLGGVGERPIHGRTDEQKLNCSKAHGGRAIQDELGNVYQTKMEAADKLNIAHQAITRVMNGKDRHAGGHTFSYVGEELPKKYVAKGSRGPCSEETKLKISRKHGGKSFKDQYGTIYKTISEAAKLIGCSSKAVGNILNKRKKSVKGFTFIYINETEFQDLSRVNRPKGLIYKNHKPKSEPKPKKILIDENNKTYKTLDEAAKALDLSIRSISRLLSGEFESIKGHKLSYLSHNLIVDIGDF
jgi:hypothetical protein